VIPKLIALAKKGKKKPIPLIAERECRCPAGGRSSKGREEDEGRSVFNLRRAGEEGKGEEEELAALIVAGRDRQTLVSFDDSGR